MKCAVVVNAFAAEAGVVTVLGATTLLCTTVLWTTTVRVGDTVVLKQSKARLG